MRLYSDGEVLKVMCHAVFECKRCGGNAIKLTLAPVNFGGSVCGPGERPPGEIVCKDCQRKEQDAEREKYNANRRANSWVQRAKARLGK